jgi:hypothetical protein
MAANCLHVVDFRLPNCLLPTGKGNMRKIISAIFLVCISPISMAQPFSLQSSVAVNDKALKDYGVYKIAITRILGEGFLKNHFPIKEGRQVCKWDGNWFECGYIRMNSRSKITAEEISKISKVMMNPCPYIEKESIISFYRAIHGNNVNKTDDELVNELTSLQRFCKNEVFHSDFVRTAIPKVENKNKRNKISELDQIDFEARIITK